jgi:hydrophobe/amphiphile efflux-3 (HAE3) family protein
VQYHYWSSLILLLFRNLAVTVIKHPKIVLSIVLAITAVLAAFATQSVNVQEVITEDNELTQALDTIDDIFGEPTSVLQIVLENDQDIRSADSLSALISIENAIRQSEISGTLITDSQQPAIVSFLSGVEQAAQAAGLDPVSLDDDMVITLQRQAFETLPPQFASLFENLLGSGNPPTTGIMLVFQNTAGLDTVQIVDQQRELANVISGVAIPNNLTVTPFGFGLLLTASDPGPEIGRLFGIALTIVLIILSLVYWLKPQAGQRRIIFRRTAVDVGLTLAVIIMAVIWMQGIGVLLGPDYLNIIGYFSPQTQVVPILIVGLGVDFAIHILGRYRSEVGSSGDPEKALHISMTTTGFTLMLATGATAIGFLTNLSSPVSFLATLGVLAAVGIIAAFLLTVTFLPAIRLMLDRRAARIGDLPLKALASQAKGSLSKIAEHTALLAERIPVVTVVIAVLLTALGGYGFTQLDSEFNLTDFVPTNEPLLATYNTIVDQFDGGFEERTQILITSEAVTPQAHNALISAITKAKDVPGVQNFGEFVDANSIASVLGQAFSTDLAFDLASFGIGEDLKVGNDTNVEALYNLLINKAPGADQVLVRSNEGTLIIRVDLRTTAGQDGAATLAANLNELFSPLEEAGMTVVTTSQSIAQARQSEAIENSQVLSLLIALSGAMILLVIYYAIYFRRPFIGVITVLPVGFVLALTFGTMAITGIPINPVTATLAALSIGIGVPYTIHFTSRFLEERVQKNNCDSALRRTVSQTGGALAGSALTTAIGFGVLITSTLIPFQQLGYVIVYAIIYSLMASILVLPSMLMLWDTWDRRRHGPPAPTNISIDNRATNSCLYEDTDVK